MKIIKAMGAALLLAGTLLFSACNKESIKKDFSQENLTLTSWNGTVEINDLNVVLDLSIRFDVENQCFLRWINDGITNSEYARYQIDEGKRLRFTDYHVICFPFSSGPWTVIEFSNSKLVLRYAIESPDEKDHQTMVLKRVE